MPDASNVITQDFYVDDLMTGVDTVENAIQLRDQLIQSLSSVGFRLRKWASNNSQVLTDLPTEEVVNFMNNDLSEASLKTLGMSWRPVSDIFFYKIQNLDLSLKCTKRNVLSDLAKVFDPLGLISPTSVQFKIIIKELWRKKLDWDDEVPPEISTKWKRSREDLSELNKLSITRLASEVKSATDVVQLHGFSDASEAAYGACIYLRSRKDTQFTTRLLIAKSRIAPEKATSIPRLELCAAVLLTQLYHKVKTTLPDLQQCYFWTDSTIVLAWLEAFSSNWKTYVANRVAEIQEHTKPAFWNHVPSEEHPADIVSRGMSARELINSSLWWHGPRWLANDELLSLIIKTKNETNLEKKNIKESANFLVTADDEGLSMLYERYSSYTRLIRVTAYCLRFAANTKKGKGERVITSLTTQEYPDIDRIHTKGNVSQKSKLRPLNPFIDKTGLLRVGGRLQNSSFAYSQQHLIILPKCKFSLLLFAHTHLALLHGGPQILLSSIRRTYWPLGARSLAKKTVHSCITCYKVKPRFVTPIMGQLPKCRVEQTQVFLKIGIDYCGPFILKTNRRRKSQVTKTYVAVFVCMATKAVHLELALDLSTEEFLSVLKRFVGRRGNPTHIHSDNGRNFLGASKELKTLFNSEEYQRKINDFAAQRNIEWHFIPPLAPEFGGLWEASVKSFKYHFKRIAGNSSLTYNDMITLLVLIEACLNSRPISPMSNDPTDLQPLTPGHFLIGRSLTAPAESDLQLIPENHLSQWQRVQKMSQQFWQRWSSEYVSTLQQRSKWNMKKKDQSHKLKEGQLVLIQEKNAPSLSWKLGRISKLFPGQDGVVRVAEILTAKGTLKRATRQLCPLPQ